MTRKDPPSKAARLYAAAMATLDDGGPAFGVRVLKRGAGPSLRRTIAAYKDPSEYPLPNPRNWLSQMQNTDPKTLPKAARNMLTSVIAGAVQDPVSALMPFPKAGLAVKATRAARLAQYEAAKTAEATAARAARMSGYKERMGAVDVSLEQLRKTTQQRTAEQTVLKQRRVAPVQKPEPYRQPQLRFTRQGPKSAAELPGSVAAKPLPARPLVEKELGMSRSARMKRAKEMGFDTKEKLFHGTSENFDAFNQPINWLTTNPKRAAEYATGGPYMKKATPNVMPLLARSKKVLTISGDAGTPMTYKQLREITGLTFDEIKHMPNVVDGKEVARYAFRMVNSPEFVKAAKAAGYDAVRITENGVPTVGILNPKNIRSKYAKFDPTKLDSENLSH